MAQNKQSPYRRSRRPTQTEQADISSPPNRRPTSTNFPEVGKTMSTYTPQNQQSSKASSVKGRQAKLTKKRVIVAFAAILLLLFGWLGFKFVFNVQRLFGGNVLSVLTASKLDGESTGRVNILLAGNSADDVGHQGGALTDSIMVLSIDTKHKTGFMMSVPRDLYVRVGDNGRAKINTAYPTGENDDFNEPGYAPGGMGLLQKTIFDNLGISTQYYALVNYNALREAVNSVGGIDVTINSTNPRGLYDPSKDYTTGGVLVRLKNGSQHLNGQQALNLARARGDARGSYGFPNSDFNRTENQRMIILALRAKATTAGVLANPVKLGNLFDSVGGNVETDMNLGNVRRLYNITKGISGGQIQSIGLNDANGQNLLANYRTPGGASALVPAAGTTDYTDIKRYVQRLTSNNLVIRENASVVLLNGTVASGLAAREAESLETKNILVGSLADADTEDYAVTTIINRSAGAKPATLKALKAAYPGATVVTSSPLTSKYDADFIVVLGADRITSQ